MQVFFSQATALQRQESKRQHTEGDVMVPADPRAHLVVGEPDLALGCLEDLFDAVAVGSHGDKLGWVERNAGIGEEVPGATASERLHHEQRFFTVRATIAPRLHSRAEGTHLQWPLLPIAQANPGPALTGQLLLAEVDLLPRLPPPRPMIGPPHERIARDLEEIALSPVR